MTTFVAEAPAQAAAGTTAKPAASASSSSSSSPDASGPGHASGKPDPRAAALSDAEKSGKPVTVASLTTADSTTTANANGSFTTVTTALPTRVKDATGAWRDLDATLERHSDGTITTTATPDSLVLSGGGAKPLVTLADPSGHSFSLALPVSLPAPSLSGPTATYPNVYPGVDLMVTALTTGGFRDVVEVRDAAAASTAEHLRFRTILQHLTLREDSSGNLAAVDPSTGKTVISAPPAALWDSATGASAAQDTPEDGAALASGSSSAPATSSANAPGPGAHTARLPITVSPAGLSLAGDASSLLGSGVRYPVYFDPTWSEPTTIGGEINYDEVQSGCPSYENFDESGLSPGVGQEDIYNPCAGVYRAYYTVDTSGVNSADTIVSSTLKLTEDYSALDSCNEGSETITAYWTSPVTTGTSWNAMPGIDPRGNPIVSANSESVGNSNGTECTGGTLALDLNFTGATSQLAAINAPSLTFGLYGNEASGSESLQRFTSNPALYTTYDIVPNTPTAAQLSTSPAPHTAYNKTVGCVEGGTEYLNKSSLGGTDAAVLSATLTSRAPGAQLYGYFEFDDHTANVETFLTSSAYVGSGGTVSVETPALVSGHLYTWQVQAEDGFFPSGTSPYCTFTADLSSPTNPVVASTDYPASGSGKTSAKYAGESGTFTLASTDPAPSGGSASGLAGYYYSLDTPIPATGGSFTSGSSIAETPAAWGIHTLYVQAVDNADNVSAQTQYIFYAPWNPASKVTAGDVGGDGIPDLVATTSSGNLVEYPGDADPGDAPVTISTPSYSPTWSDGAADASWANYIVTHRGSFSNGPADDLWAYDKTSQQLYLYKNENAGFEDTSQIVTVSKADVISDGSFSVVKPDSGSGCATTTYSSCADYDNSDWSKLTQIVAVGDLYAGSKLDNGDPGVLTVEDGELWYYQGLTTNQYLGTAVQLGTSGWNAVTLIGPGTVAGVPVLWARDNASGKIYSYPISFDSGTGYLENLGTPTTADTVLAPPGGVALTAASYPAIVSPGDLHGTGDPDLVAVTTNGDVIDFPGTAPVGTGGTFGAPTSLGDPSTTASTSSVSFPSDGTRYPTGSVWTTKKTTLTFVNGTLSITDTASGKLLATYGDGGASEQNAFLDLQADGYLDIYNDSTNPTAVLWSVDKTGDAYDQISQGTSIAGDTLALEADGNLDLAAGAGKLIWGSGTIGNQDAGSGYCLDADTNTVGRNGSVVQLWACNSSPEQNWTLALNSVSGGYQIQSTRAGTAYCLDADTNTMGANGTKVQLWSCNGASEQQWPATLGSGTYAVSNGNSKAAGYCLDADTNTIGENGTVIQLWTCSAASEQKWLF